MKKKLIVATLTCLAAAPLTGAAEEHEPDETYIYATYMYCDTTRQDEADKIFEEVHKPVLEAAKRDGTIRGWGWLVHHTGGQWRRIRWHQSNSIVGALEALDTMQDAIEKAFGEDDTGDFKGDEA